MKKLLTTLSIITIAIAPASEVVSCYNSSSEIQKKPITEENLKNFFEKNNTYEYTGEYFFKDISEQSKWENANFPGIAGFYFDKLISDSFSAKFNNEFDYDLSNYNFSMSEYDPSWTNNGIQLNTPNKLIFDISVKTSTNKLIFEAKNLIFNFLETNQYNDYDWFMNNINFWSGDGLVIFNSTIAYFAGYKHMILNPIAFYNTDEEKDKYTKNDDPFVLDGISDQCTNDFSIDAGGGYWLYDNKKMNVIATKYEYLGNIPGADSDYGVRSKASLKFTSLSNDKLSTEKSVELWMRY